MMVEREAPSSRDAPRLVPQSSVPQTAGRADEGFTVWLTGVPAAGKTTLGALLYQRLRAQGRRVELLDGDAVRRQLSPDLGFSRADRDANVARVGFVAERLCRHGVVVIVSLVSPYAAARSAVRERIARFVEVHVHCARSECERRDPKGLYALSRRGLLVGLTGVDDPYEAPERPELALDTQRQGPDACVTQLMSTLAALGLV
jgi:adenylylsulfate kinase